MTTEADKTADHAGKFRLPSTASTETPFPQTTEILRQAQDDTTKENVVTGDRLRSMYVNPLKPGFLVHFLCKTEDFRRIALGTCTFRPYFYESESIVRAFLTNFRMFLPGTRTFRINFCMFRPIFCKSWSIVRGLKALVRMFRDIFRRFQLQFRTLKRISPCDRSRARVSRDVVFPSAQCPRFK